MKEIEDLLAQCKPLEPPKRNKNKKTISLKGRLYGLNKIFKVLAPYDRWIDLEEYYSENEMLEFKDIPFSRISKSDLQVIEHYYDEDPITFSSLFYTQFILPANRENPLSEQGKKSRGTAYRLDRGEMIQVRLVARHFYILFNYWFNKERTVYPRWLTDFLVKYHIADKNDPIVATQHVIAKLFDSVGLIDDEYEYEGKGLLDQDYFFKRYLKNEQHFDSIEKLYKKTGYIPSSLIRDFFK